MPKRAFLFFFLLSIAGIFFWQVATGVNARKYDTEEYRRVAHPDFIPSRSSVAIGGVGYDAAIGDSYWLETIQYIGAHAVGAEYKKYLAALLGLITDIDPRMTSAYTLGQTLLPTLPGSDAASDEHLAAAIALGHKGLANLCDARKLALIARRSDIPQPADPEVRDPCATPWIALYLGYDYYFYADEPEKALEYYKIAAAHSDAPPGVRTLATTMAADAGDPAAAARMLLSLARAPADAAPACSQMAGTLELLYDRNFRNGFLEYSFIEPVRAAGKFVDAYEREKTPEAQVCREYLMRFERMVQLMHAQQADIAYSQAHSGVHAPDADTLFRDGYLPYLPVDFQRLPNGSSGAYVYDTEADRWVVRMRSPDGKIADPRQVKRY
jgi:hypothetical protein